MVRDVSICSRFCMLRVCRRALTSVKKIWNDRLIVYYITAHDNIKKIGGLWVLNSEVELILIVAFRHAHGFMAGKSDLFFVCILRAKTSEITVQAAEIADAKWGEIEARSVSCDTAHDVLPDIIALISFLSWQEFLEQAPYPRDTPIWARLYGLARDVAEGKAKPLLIERHELVTRPGSNYLYASAP